MIYNTPYINSARGEGLQFFDLTPKLLFKMVSNLDCFYPFHLVTFFIELKGNRSRVTGVNRDIVCAVIEDSAWTLQPLCTLTFDTVFKKAFISQQMNKGQRIVLLCLDTEWFSAFCLVSSAQHSCKVCYFVGKKLNTSSYLSLFLLIIHQDHSKLELFFSK